MKAGVATEQGLAVRDIPQLRPKPNEVLVAVHAFSLNRGELRLFQTNYLETGEDIPLARDGQTFILPLAAHQLATVRFVPA